MHKHLRRLDRIWLDSPIYFITMCTKDRRAVLARDKVNEILIEEWRPAHERHGWIVGRYVIMPDHLHLFVRGDQTFVLATWVRGLKRAILKIFPSEFRTSFWQPGFFDHLLRSDESYAQKWEYVRQNPVRAGLVKFAEDWPYQGEIVRIDRA